MANTVETDLFLETVPEEELFDGWDDEDIVVVADEDESVEVAETESAETDTAEEQTDEDVSEETDTEVSEADQPTETESVAEDNQAEAEQAETKVEETPADPPKYTLKHLDETRDFTIDELQAMAQKGWDYDRVKGKVDELRAENDKLKYLEDFLNNIKGDFRDVNELIDDTNAELLVKNEAENGRVLDKETARARVKANREKLFAEAKGKAETERNKMFTEFGEIFGNPDPKSIPQEVWEEFNVTGDLIRPYGRYINGQLKTELKSKDEEISKLKAEIDALKQNAKNKERSTGSRKSVGNPQKADPMFEGWDD